MAPAAATAAPMPIRGERRSSENAARGCGEGTDRGLQGWGCRPQPGGCPHPRLCRSSSANPAPHRCPLGCALASVLGAATTSKRSGASPSLSTSTSWAEIPTPTKARQLQRPTIRRPARGDGSLLPARPGAVIHQGGRRSRLTLGRAAKTQVTIGAKVPYTARPVPESARW